MGTIQDTVVEVIPVTIQGLVEVGTLIEASDIPGIELNPETTITVVVPAVVELVGVRDVIAIGVQAIKNQISS